ncbi:hypothetical protein LINPERHAP1_LOCUS22400, partial [Linum perenne]
SHPWRGTNFCLQDNYFRRYLSLEKKLYFQCLPSSSLLPTHWRRLSIPKNRGTAPKGLKSWIHHFGGDTNFFKKFNPAQRKTLGLVKDFNPAQPNSSTLVPTLFLYVFSEPDYQTIIAVNVTRE